MTRLHITAPSYGPNGPNRDVICSPAGCTMSTTRQSKTEIPDEVESSPRFPIAQTRSEFPCRRGSQPSRSRIGPACGFSSFDSLVPRLRGLEAVLWLPRGHLHHLLADRHGPFLR